VADELSFRRAAERVGIAQPALSRQVRALEQRLGLPLFVRTTRRVELTAAGRVFLEEARRSHAHADRAVAFAREVAAGRRGHLAVAYTHASISGPLPEIVTAFRRRFPDVRLVLQEMWTDWQAKALLEGAVDIGFAMPAVLRPDLEHIEVNAEPWVVVAREDHPLAQCDELPIGRLREEPFILGTMDRWRHFREMINEMAMVSGGFVPRVAHEESEIHAILGLVAAGVGITIYPECIRNYHRIGLAVLPLGDDLPPVRTLAAWRADNGSEALRHFVSIIGETTRAVGGGRDCKALPFDGMK
jgi:DNA-binding transcriptional LysR family regulator